MPDTEIVITEAGPFKFISLGAILQAFTIGGKNIVLGFNGGPGYGDNPAFFGATIGRVANRIEKGKINDLNGKSYDLAINNTPNNLHGGSKGWNQYIFNGPVLETEDSCQTAKYTIKSPHLDEGFPGTLDATVTYEVSTEKEGGHHVDKLTISYEARLADDSPVDETIVSMTNHGYFNIGNTATIEGTEVTLETVTQIAVDENDIPTGELKPFPGLEANIPFILGVTEPDIDHGFSLITDAGPFHVPMDTRVLKDRLCARLYNPDTKITVEVLSSEPQFQLYTGKYIDTKERADGTPAFGQRAGIAIEPCRFTNAINVPDWRHMVLLKKGDTYGSRIVYRAWQA